jgi:hypothetical protein
MMTNFVTTLKGLILEIFCSEWVTIRMRSVIHFKTRVSTILSLFEKIEI